MKLNTGMNLSVDLNKMGFIYDVATTEPLTEKRRLDDICTSLSDSNAEEPSIVYAVAMDIAKKKYMQDLINRNLLYGAMIFEKGVIGEESVRSWGYIHAASVSCNASTCEVYEIWAGEAYIYMQEYAGDDPGRCFAVHVRTKDVVIVSSGWAHCTINADPSRAMLFGAWCVRDYDLDYEQARVHRGVALFLKVKNGSITFVQNTQYHFVQLEILKARAYPEFHLEQGVPIYMQYEKDPERFRFATHPQEAEEQWKEHRPRNRRSWSSILVQVHWEKVWLYQCCMRAAVASCSWIQTRH